MSPSRDRSGAYLAYVVGLLSLVNVFNYMDRSIVGALTEPIKSDLGLSDTQMGLLGGLAFAAFYATMGIPIARLADRGNRRSIIAAAIAIWSGMTALCGLATTFPQLFLARMGVGIGEAGGLPPAHSIIADYFPPERRARAMAFLLVGALVGTLLGMVLGAEIAKHYGWRAAFLCLGIPGMVFALVVRLTLDEPTRGQISAEARSLGGQLPFGASLARLLGRRAYVHMLCAFSLAGFAAAGAGQWAVAFLMRTFDVEMTKAATSYGVTAMLSTVVATVASGFVADRAARRDLRWQLWIPSLALGMACPLAIAMYMAPTFETVVVMLVPYHLAVGIYAPPIFAAIQAVVESELRALAQAIAMFATALVGMGLGPLAVGVLSDQLAPIAGKESLRWALVGMQVLLSWSALHLWIASRHYRRDIAAVEARTASDAAVAVIG